MFKNLFNPDNALMTTMTQITDCIFLSLFFLVGCFPVVTAGASFAALYDAAFRGCRRGEKKVWHRFFRVFRDNWKDGILPTVVVAGLIWALLKGVIGIWNAAVAGSVSFAVFSGAALLAVAVLGILSLVFPILSRFENSFAGLMKNAVVLGFANMPRVLAVGVVNAVTVFLCVRYVVPLFFLPALAAMIDSLFIEPIFKPFMPPEEAA